MVTLHKTIEETFSSRKSSAKHGYGDGNGRVFILDFGGAVNFRAEYAQRQSLGDAVCWTIPETDALSKFDDL